MLYYIFIIICLIKIINAVVENENEILSKLSQNTNKVTLEINSKINVIEKININKQIKILSLTGISDSATIISKYPLYFDSNVEEIEIKNININGTLFFKNNKNISLISVKLSGYIDSDFSKDTNNNIEIKNLFFKPEKETVENCINLSGNVKISNSYFLGSSSCRNRLLHFNGLNNYILNLKDSKFNGQYQCPFFIIENFS